jgi:hypothetical protein
MPFTYDKYGGLMMKIRMGWKAKASLLFLIFAMVYLIVPLDVLPFSFFDDVTIVLVAVAIWIVVVIIEGKRGGE